MQGFAAQSNSGRELWLANLTAERQRVTIEGVGSVRGARLGAEDFEAAAADPGFLDRMEGMDSVELEPYAVARLALQR
jgi:hypothetical protein